MVGVTFLEIKMRHLYNSSQANVLAEAHDISLELPLFFKQFNV